MIDSVETVVNRFLQEAWDGRNLESAGALLDEDVVVYRHGIIDKGRVAWRNLTEEFWSRTPQGALKYEKLLVDGNLVAVRWEIGGDGSDAPRPGRGPIDAGADAGLAVFRVLDGKITDLWDQPGARLVRELASAWFPE